MDRYDSTIYQVKHETRRRQHEITFASHVVVPAAIAILVTIAAAFGVLSSWQPYAPKPPAWPFAVLWCVIFVVVLLVVVRAGGSIEVVTGYDWNNDGIVGPPQPKQPTISTFDVNHYQDGKLRQTQIPTFSIPEATAMRLLQMALDDDRQRNAIIAENRVARGNKAIVTGPEWSRFMAELRLMNWAEWRGNEGRSGHKLTEQGRETIQSMIEQWVASK